MYILNGAIGRIFRDKIVLQAYLGYLSILYLEICDSHLVDFFEELLLLNIQRFLSEARLGQDLRSFRCPSFDQVNFLAYF